MSVTVNTQFVFNPEDHEVHQYDVVTATLTNDSVVFVSNNKVVKVPLTLVEQLNSVMNEQLIKEKK